MLLAVAPLAVGCVRVHASITVSPDDQVSGQIIAAAKVRDLEARLRRGLDHLATHGQGAAVDDPEAALAGLVAQHLADAVWREASGRSLVLAHGQPRNRQQQAILRELTRELVDHDFSLRALVIAVALHPALDLGEPSACAAPLPPILDPFAAADHMDLSAALSMEGEVQRRLGMSHDYLEGVAAFFAKRPPQFKDR